MTNKEGGILYFLEFLTNYLFQKLQSTCPTSQNNVQLKQ